MVKKSTTSSSEFDVIVHELVPKHDLCPGKEREKIVERFGVSEQQIPRIPFSDPAIQHLGAKEGDLIRITRKSLTAGSTIFYRIVSME